MANRQVQGKPYIARPIPRVTYNGGANGQMNVSGRVWSGGGVNYQDIYTEPVPAQHIRTWTVLVSTTTPQPNPLFMANPNRLSILISNVSAGTIFLHEMGNITIGALDSFPLGPGQSIAFDSYIGLLYAVATAPLCSVGLIELSV